MKIEKRKQIALKKYRMQYIDLPLKQEQCTKNTANGFLVYLELNWSACKTLILVGIAKYAAMLRSRGFLLAVLILMCCFFVYSFKSEQAQRAFYSDEVGPDSKSGFKNKNLIAGLLTGDSIAGEDKSDVLALAEVSEEHDEKKLNAKISSPVLLTGFYGDSKYPSHEIYQLWDTEVLYPYTHEIKKKNEKLKLVLQDKVNYCNYVPPFEGPITSVYGYRWGRRHQGIDIDLETNDPVLASFDGMVRISQEHPSYGNVIIIRHYNGLETVYAHLNKLQVEPGDIVNAGQTIGLGGNTGRSTGSHLHYEIRFKGEALNPQNIISFSESCLVSDSIKVVRVNNAYVAVPMGVPFHSVKKGEYLYLIANKYGTTVSHLCEINEIPRNKALQIGQMLRVA